MEKKYYKVQEHKQKLPDGTEKSFFTVQWGATFQKFNTKEEAEKFIEQHGTVDKSVRLEKRPKPNQNAK